MPIENFLLHQRFQGGTRNLYTTPEMIGELFDGHFPFPIHVLKSGEFVFAEIVERLFVEVACDRILSSQDT